MYEGSFEEYRAEINALMERVKELSSELSNDQIVETVNKVLDWVEDKPGQEVSLRELGEALGDPSKGIETFLRMGPLIGGKPMTEVVIKVHAPDGKQYLLHDVYRASQGCDYVVPGSLEPLASSRAELEAKCSVHFQIANFTRQQKLVP